MTDRYVWKRRVHSFLLRNFSLQKNTASGTYTITSDAYQNVARLPKNTFNTAVNLVAESGAENESVKHAQILRDITLLLQRAIKTFADGTFAIKNKKFNETAFATAALSSGSKVTGGNGIQWKQGGSLITASDLAWEATADGKILVKPKDALNSTQAFSFTFA